MPEIFIFAPILNAVLCGLLSLHLFLIDTKNRLPNRILSINYALYAGQGALLFGVLSQFEIGILLLRPAIAMLLGPGLFLYWCSLKKPQWHPSFWVVLHGLPAIVVGGLVSIPNAYAWLIDYMILCSFSVYIIVVIYEICTYHALEHLGEYSGVARRWLWVLSSFLAISLFLDIGVLIELKSGVALNDSLTLVFSISAFVVINIATVLGSLHRIAIFAWMFELGEHALQKSSSQTLTVEEAEALLRRWELLVESQQLYRCEYGITLSQAAKKLQVPARHLSQAINSICGKSYSKFLNDRRVQAARELLASASDMTITQIMHESGFSSKSHFNKEFQRVEGVSPSVFRARLGTANT